MRCFRFRRSSNEDPSNKTSSSPFQKRKKFSSKRLFVLAVAKNKSKHESERLKIFPVHIPQENEERITGRNNNLETFNNKTDTTSNKNDIAQNNSTIKEMKICERCIAKVRSIQEKPSRLSMDENNVNNKVTKGSKTKRRLSVVEIRDQAYTKIRESPAKLAGLAHLEKRETSTNKDWKGHFFRRINEVDSLTDTSFSNREVDDQRSSQIDKEILLDDDVLSVDYPVVLERSQGVEDSVFEPNLVPVSHDVGQQGDSSKDSGKKTEENKAEKEIIAAEYDAIHRNDVSEIQPNYKKKKGYYKGFDFSF